MAQSSEEAMNHFSKDLSLFFSEFCHYFDFEVGLITNPQTPFYKELKKEITKNSNKIMKKAKNMA